MVQFKAGVRWAIAALAMAGLGLALDACGARDSASTETVESVQARVIGPDPVPCDAWGNAVIANTGSVLLNAQTLVDSYSSSAGAYGGSNVGSSAIVRAATTITNNGAVVHGQLVSSAPSGLAVVPVPAGVTNLPLGSSSPGSLNINTAGSSITLAPGNYVAANINVNAPGAIKISPAGQVRIWVTGTLNLGGSENLNGSPHNLAFLVTSSGFVNVNSGGVLYGTIYAPTSGINVNSTVFGSVVGGSISLLNSGAAVHSDTAAACPPPVFTSTVSTPVQLPAPPNVRGCYIGTWNGWKSTPCTTADKLPTGVAPKPFIGGGQVTIPNYLVSSPTSYGNIPGITSPAGLRFGQVSTTFVDVAATGDTEVNIPSAVGFQAECDANRLGYTIAPPQQPNNLSIQANSNNFPANSGDAGDLGDLAWVQFTIQSVGAGSVNRLPSGVIRNTVAPGFAICIWNNDFTLGKADVMLIPDPTAPSCSATAPCDPARTCAAVTGQGNHCLAQTYYADCLASSAYTVVSPSPGYNLALQPRELQPLDNASVAASAFDDGNDSQHDVGMVAALSWFEPSGSPTDYRGLFAVVTKDRYGLGTGSNWTTITGTALGLGNCGMASFPAGTMVYTSVQAGNCGVAGAPPTGVPATVSWPGVCPNTTQLSSTPVPSDSTSSFTDESNNLNIVGSIASPLANAGNGTNYLETHYLATTDGACVGTPRVYVKDNAQDQGAIPSNLGGQAFWESPDIIVVPTHTPVTTATQAPDPIVIAGTIYDIYVRVHNEYACASVPGVQARLWWGNAALAMPAWTVIPPQNADPNNPAWSAPKPLPLGDSLDLIGPISWQAPGNVSPHECLLANIQAMGEVAPTNTSDTPSSKQVAQRNIEIGGACAWALANNNQPSQLSVTFTTKDGNSQPYLLQSGDAVSIVFDDINQALYNSWNANAHPGCTLTPGPGKTTVTLLAGFGQVTVTGAPLPASATLNVTATVVPVLFSGTAINLGIETFFGNGSGTTVPVPINGSTCQGTAQNGGPR
jgi:hypothetical protein